MIYRDRAEAGKRLAERLAVYAGRADVLVLGLPRGGVPVAYEVACGLRAPLDIFLVRKLGVPGREELAMGAIATGGVRFVNEPVVEELRITPDVIEAAAAREQGELERRERAYRGERGAPDVGGRVCILVDDGLATGSTMLAAARALKKLGPARVVVAVPVAPREACAALGTEADEVVCAETPDNFKGVGRWYEDFTQTTDEEVRALLSSTQN